MNSIDKIKNDIDKIENIYGVDVALKLQLQLKNCFNCEWYYDDLNETLFRNWKMKDSIGFISVLFFIFILTF